MNEVDHMLNGRGSRQHLQRMIRQAEQDRLARDVEAAQSKDKPVSPLRVLLTILLHFVSKF